jgi:hypothetical protein
MLDPYIRSMDGAVGVLFAATRARFEITGGPPAAFDRYRSIRNERDTAMKPLI